MLLYNKIQTCDFLNHFRQFCSIASYLGINLINENKMFDFYLTDRCVQMVERARNFKQ